MAENVPHLLSHDRGRSFNRIAQEIQAAGYWFMPRENATVLNTKIHTNICSATIRIPCRVASLRNVTELIDVVGRGGAERRDAAAAAFF